GRVDEQHVYVRVVAAVRYGADLDVDDSRVLRDRLGRDLAVALDFEVVLSAEREPGQVVREHDRADGLEQARARDLERGATTARRGRRAGDRVGNAVLARARVHDVRHRRPACIDDG